jgi:hypothetical protein
MINAFVGFSFTMIQLINKNCNFSLIYLILNNPLFESHSKSLVDFLQLRIQLSATVLRFHETLLFKDSRQRQNSKKMKVTNDLIMVAPCFHVASRK